jgi:prevent-host-death family protein
MTSIPENTAGKKLKQLIGRVSSNHDRIKITGKEGNAVLISEYEWRSIEETLYLLSIPKMRQSIIKGLNTPVEKCIKSIKW